MNIKNETKRRLNYHNNKLKDLKECLNAATTIDAIHYINDEITKANKNIEYYSELVKKIEGEN